MRFKFQLLNFEILNFFLISSIHSWRVTINCTSIFVGLFFFLLYLYYKPNKKKPSNNKRRQVQSMETKTNSIEFKKILTKTRKNNLRKKTWEQRSRISKNVPNNNKGKKNQTKMLMKSSSYSWCINISFLWA